MLNLSRFLQTDPKAGTKQELPLSEFIRLFKTHKYPTLDLAKSWIERLYLSPQFVKSYTAFNNDPYSWQIVHQDGRCELLIICWRKGQRSYVHNHDGQLAVLKIYSGKLVYSANWGEEFEQLSFWNELDFIGIDCYYPLGKDPSADKTVLKAKFEEVLATIERVHQHNDKKN